MSINAHVVRITLCTNPGPGRRLIERVRTDSAGIIGCISRDLCQHQTMPVGPAFAHATALLGIQSSGVRWSTGQAVGDTMAVLVGNDPIVEIPVAIGVR